MVIVSVSVFVESLISIYTVWVIISVYVIVEAGLVMTVLDINGVYGDTLDVPHCISIIGHIRLVVKVFLTVDID